MVRMDVGGSLRMGRIDVKRTDGLSSDAKLKGQILWMSREHQASLSGALAVLRLKLLDHATQVENSVVHTAPTTRTRSGPAALDELEQKLAAMREAHAKALRAIEAKQSACSPGASSSRSTHGTPQSLRETSGACAAGIAVALPAGQAALEAFDAKLQAAVGRASVPARSPATLVQDAPRKAALDAFDARIRREMQHHHDSSSAACSSLNSTGSTCSGVALGTSSGRSSSAGSSSGQLLFEQDI